ncbi:MAG TPA: uroporphyrinogen-III C-methyltransferase [Methylibium sp.]|nr:uroporphyrinogen-III C-methyltransferase [Methylibium sp.]
MPSADAPAEPAAAEAPRPEPVRGPTPQTLLLAAAGIVALVAIGLSWRAGERVQALEQELVRRQQDSQTQATEAALLARQAQDLSREAVTKASLLEGRVAEVAQQRGQLDELILSLSRSRDENLLADIEAGVRVAQQQTAITGSAEPLVAALRAADERLARTNQPRLDAIRRAITRDLDRIKGVGVADLASLAVKLDEGVRLVDDAPLLAFEPPRRESPKPAPAASVPRAGPKPVTPPPAEPVGGLAATVGDGWRRLWAEVTTLVRVTRIEEPDAMLLAPEQSWFLRENLKLRLLNARVALLSRQFDTAQADLQAALAATERHFDRNARKTATLIELLRGVAVQARHAGVPRPDDTLAALATAAAAR